LKVSIKLYFWCINSYYSLVFEMMLSKWHVNGMLNI